MTVRITSYGSLIGTWAEISEYIHQTAQDDEQTNKENMFEPIFKDECKPDGNAPIGTCCIGTDECGVCGGGGIDYAGGKCNCAGDVEDCAGVCGG